MYFTVDLHAIIPVDLKYLVAIGTGIGESTRDQREYGSRCPTRDWHRCCPFGDGYVMNVTALLLLLTLTGSPIASLSCISWCASPHSTHDAICHEAPAQAADLTISESDNACARLLSTSPFLKEEGQTAHHPPSLVNAVRATSLPPLESIRFGDRPNGSETARARARQPLVLRI